MIPDSFSEFEKADARTTGTGLPRFPWSRPDGNSRANGWRFDLPTCQRTAARSVPSSPGERAARAVVEARIVGPSQGKPGDAPNAAFHAWGEKHR